MGDDVVPAETVASGSSVTVVSPEAEKQSEGDASLKHFAMKITAAVLVTEKMMKNLISRAKIATPVETNIETDTEKKTSQASMIYADRETAENVIQCLEGQQLKKKAFTKEIIEVTLS